MDLQNIDPELIIDSLSRKLQIPKEYITCERVNKTPVVWDIYINGYEINRWWMLPSKNKNTIFTSEQEYLKAIDNITIVFCINFEDVLYYEGDDLSNNQLIFPIIKRLQLLYKLELLKSTN